MHEFELSDVGLVTIKKSSRARRLILKISAEGMPVVTIPSRMPFAVGVQFAKAHSSWFIKNLPSNPQVVLENNRRIGQTHHIVFKVADVTTPTSRVQGDIITVNYPPELSQNDPAVQKTARQAAIRALKKQGDAYLPSRLHQLATTHGYTYKVVSVKKMKSRWGSCSNQGHISLSIWLMQLPEVLIDYVLCHELVHLNHKHHQPSFWQELEGIVPDYNERRKLLRTYRPTLM